MAAVIEDRLEAMLERRKLSASRERLDNLLDDAGRREPSLREGPILLCEAEVAHREERGMRRRSGTSQPVVGSPMATHC